MKHIKTDNESNENSQWIRNYTKLYKLNVKWIHVRNILTDG